jgi:general stress protein 26
MKTEIQSSAERTQLCDLIREIPVAMLTTADEDGHLISRPMSPLEMDAHGALWFFTDLGSAKITQLHAVNLCFTDDATSSYVSISGRGEIVADRSHVERLWSPFARPWFPDGPDSATLALMKIIPSFADCWDAPNSKMGRMFGLAASIAAGKPVLLGNHVTLDALEEVDKPAGSAPTPWVAPKLPDTMSS